MRAVTPLGYCSRQRSAKTRIRICGRQPPRKRQKDKESTQSRGTKTASSGDWGPSECYCFCPAGNSSNEQLVETQNRIEQKQ
jgi:hypothetical protein